MSSAMPRPNQPAAGINIQNHQIFPAGAYSITRKETTTKAIPIMIPRIASSTLGSRRRFRLAYREYRSLGSSATGNCPVSACDTRLMFAPHARQKLAPSTFCVAHLGQNMFVLTSPAYYEQNWLTVQCFADA